MATYDGFIINDDKINTSRPDKNVTSSFTMTYIAGDKNPQLYQGLNNFIESLAVTKEQSIRQGELITAFDSYTRKTNEIPCVITTPYQENQSASRIVKYSNGVLIGGDGANENPFEYPRVEPLEIAWTKNNK